MTSARHVAAGFRENAKKSTGPRTRRGKSRASRNAVRHALATVNFGDSGLSDRIERLAKAICNGKSDPFLYEQAVIIAETHIFLGRVRAARIAAIDPEPELTSAERQLLLAGFPSLDPDIVLDHLNRGEIGKLANFVDRHSLRTSRLGKEDGHWNGWPSRSPAWSTI